ncbi:MAG: HEAT repeat domain-containing protein [Acidobacteria bacterium]|uniref:HEAT repeat domain-containing protein n=1 Tax=Candidatus Sulfomarinibacter kjeldsenii TaxID=2885994 RepID=A0A8J7CN95_9BACT|nr:HEAT repeat domain-containing protein [Candidatus Sulfomarinibacter kjeldsenii]
MKSRISRLDWAGRSGLPGGPGNATGPRRGLGSAVFGIRAGEGPLAWLFFLNFLILTTVHFAAKTVRQATYIDAWGAENLPWVYLAVAAVSLPVLIVYSRAAARVRLPMLILAVTLLHVLGLVLFFYLFGLGQKWVAVLYYVWLGMAFAIAVSQFWTYANQVFDPRQARRLFAFIGAGGLLGAMFGGLLAAAVTRFAGTRFTLLAAAAVLLSLPLLVVFIERNRGPAPATPRTRRRIRYEEARGGLRTLRGSRLLALIGLLMLASVMIGQLVAWQFNWYVEQHTEALDERTAVFAYAFILMGVVGFLFQLIFTGRIHRSLGVGFGMRVLPGTVMLTQLAVVVAIFMSPVVALVYPLVWVLYLGENSFRHSVDQATRELLFLPVAEELRVKAKAFIDVFIQRFAKGAAAILILVTLKFLPAGYVSALTLVLAVGWMAITLRTRREYVTAFREGLKSGSIQPDATIDTQDVTTVTTLMQSLGSSDPRTVLHSLELLSASGEGRLVPPVLLHHDSAEVRCKTLDILADTGREDAAHMVEQALGDEDAEVRTGAMRTLTQLRRERAAELMLQHLDERDPRLRASAVVSLLGNGEGEGVDRAEQVFAEMVGDDNPQVRAEIAGALGQVGDPVASDILVQLLYDRDLKVVQAAIGAVRHRFERSGPNPLYATILISLMGNRRLKHEAREALVAEGEGAMDPLLLFMRSPDEQIWVRRAVPKTIALMESQAAVDALVDSLEAPDAMLRTKIIEALGYLRTRRLDLKFNRRKITHRISDEAGHYLRVHIFGLLELVEEPEDVRAAQRSLLSGQTKLRSRALEYLDNTLSGSLRRDLFAVIDDAPPEEKLRRAQAIFGVHFESPEETLKRMIQIDPMNDPSAIGIVLAALYNVWDEEIVALYPMVKTLAEEAEEPMVKETAAWVCQKVEAGPRTRGVLARGGESEMGPMAQIEMMVFLQGVDLFAHCNADQVLRLAAIASEHSYEKGEVMFRREEPADGLFCVVEGRVRLDADEGTGVVVGPSGRFGVLDILSGRARLGDAVAASDSRVLIIEAEDFFDLLSHNIEIVRALFRSVIALGEDASERLL